MQQRVFKYILESLGTDEAPSAYEGGIVDPNLEPINDEEVKVEEIDDTDSESSHNTTVTSLKNLNT